MTAHGDASAVERVFRQEYGRSVSVLARAFGDIDLAEEGVQEAFAVAAQRWAADGVPPRPIGLDALIQLSAPLLVNGAVRCERASRASGRFI